MEKRRNSEKAIMQAGLKKASGRTLILSAQNELTRLLTNRRDYNKNKDLIENKESFTLELAKVAKALLVKQKDIKLSRRSTETS